jgi:hypothetical protein
VTEQGFHIKKDAAIAVGPLKFKISLDDEEGTVRFSQGALSRGEIELPGDVVLNPKVVALANDSRFGISISFLPPWLHATEITRSYDSVRSFSAKCDEF